MPKQKKKRFIDPKKSVTFEVVPRNQVDPLAADETAPKNVLIEKKSRRVVETEYTPTEVAADKRIEEQRKYGIYFDDDYNYLQHLRDVRTVAEMEPVKVVRIEKEGVQVEIEAELSEEDEEASVAAPGRAGPSIRLPSSVFASSVQDRVGLLNKNVANSGPRLNWDPEVMATLDDDFKGAEDDLEDDFVALASGGQNCIEDLGAGDEELTTKRFYYTEQNDSDNEMFGDSDEEYDDVGEMNFAGEETKSRFSQYSLSSSVMTRTGGLKTLDEHFEKMFEEYDDQEVGALDDEDIEGNLAVESALVTKLAEQYDEMVKMVAGGVESAIGDADKKVKTKAMQSLKGGEEEMTELKMIDRDPMDEQKWDCESILSTYSTLYNRPKIIELPKKSEKIQLSSRGMPVEEKPGLTKKALRELDGDFLTADDYAKSVCTRASAVSSTRPKGETAEERKARKQQVKEFRRERRVERKTNAMAFKAEESRQKVVDLNLRNNLQGLKIL